MALTSTNVQSLLDELSTDLQACVQNTVVRHMLYSAQIGLTQILELTQAKEGISPKQPNKGAACNYVIQSVSKTGTTKTLTDGIAYRFDRQWFRDNLQNGSLDIRTTYYLTEECSGVILTMVGGTVGFDFVESDPDSAKLTAKWSSLS